MARPRFQKTVFKNGFTLITERMPGFQSLSLGIWVKAGTRHEAKKEAGISHYLEHMLFKGTEKRSALQIAREVDQVGGEFNAFTSREYTCFHLLVLKADLDFGLDILTDVLLNSKFDSTEFETERKVILQEISMVDENPEELAHDRFFELVYSGHPLGLPILGTERSIRRMKRQDMVKYFRDHYRPDELILSVAGDVSDATIKKKLGHLIKQTWPGRTPGKLKKTAPRKMREPKAQFLEGVWWVPSPSEQVHMVYGVEALKSTSVDRIASVMLNVYLGGGMSSVLFQEIRERNGLAYTVYSMLNPFVDSGLLTIYAGTTMSQIPFCVKLIDDTLAKLSKDLLTEKELQATKDNLKGNILLSADSAESRMSSIAKNELFFKSYFSTEDICRQIDEVTALDLRRVARRLFASKKRSMVFLGPKPSKQIRQKFRPKIVKR